MSGAESAESAFKRFRDLTRKLATVPKREIDAQRKKPKRPTRAPKLD